MPNTLRIRFRCFSFVRQALDAPQIEIDMAKGATAAEVEKTIRERTGTSLDRTSFRIAVNRRIVPGTTVLEDGDEVALIPPLQGG